ncbi:MULTISPECIES: type II secretion system F family protein [Vibrio]|uniref:Type II secretion system F family protein n=1 Tax=Vibrio parahaemolyticus TaxID=670 RepID=A0AAW8Q0T7_VIBPH|nr:MULTISPECIES: type II secretion system F family protein [Vibrio]AKU54159.1 Flp pilus assembly related type II/IV secretion system protein TadC [Vibrio parahaemolyticus]ALM67258.1 Type II/IV secretion system protein TadC, associated with Flp pilus assembly [Vibrio parahaemolyticus]ANQ55290.1 pilus assembly protein TadC [Vibrio parahaemolyticus]APE83213.1 Type II/IV secretion system protein TadC, associated with Flp pilus assembly [Vibrio parahaemolyticus]ASO15123.1 pilus assembly protein Tad
MESIQGWLSGFAINQETLLMGLILVTTVLVVMTLGSIIVGVNSPIKRKLAELSGDKKSLPSHNKKMADTLESLAPLTSPTSEKERQTTRNKLMHAGFHQSNALSLFYSIKSVTTIFGVLVSAFIYITFPGSKYVYFLMILSIFVGLFIPNIFLSRMINQRQKSIRASVADMLDLLIVCTESGLGFNAALRRVADELVVSHPELADELDTVCNKIQAGKTMPEALHEMVVRTGLEELVGLVSMLSHASRIGGSLVNSLREYTEDYRDKRQQAAEELAAKVPVKMLFPTVFFIWPCFFIVAVGPAIITLIEAFSN